MRDERSLTLSATDAAQQIRDGKLTSEELVQACLERIRALEPKVAGLDLPRRGARAGAGASRGRAKGARRADRALHGVPVGVKDIFDTADMPTENGTVLHRGRTPRHDAAAVSMLRAAGAVILGKTVTTECAYFRRARRATRTTPSTPPAGPPAARPRRSAAAWCRWPWAARPPVRSSARPRSAASTGTSRRTD